MQGHCCCRQEEIMGFRIGSAANRIQDCIMTGKWPDESSPVCASRVGSIELGIGDLHVVEAARHCKVTCTRGVVWVTGGNRLSDYILKGGESLVLQGKGKVIVSGGRNDCVVWICRD